MSGPLAPIYVSLNGGTTWTLNSIVPDNNTTFGTGDITMRFGGSSGILYTGILRGNDFLHLQVLRAPDFTMSTPMDALYDRFSEDQPYVQAATVLGGGGVGDDRVYIGNNNLAGSQSATIDRSISAATAPAPAGFGPFGLETRTTNGQDLPPIRPAIHPDGTIYGIFYRWTGSTTADVVVVRSNGWATAMATPFNALTDPSDSLAGRLVVTGRTLPPFSTVIGQNRIVWSNLSIAVDPRDSNVVYVAWADRVGTTDYTLHVRRSGDGGGSWPATDLIAITNATNPALAVTTRGHVGFLYQQLTGSPGAQRWETHLQRSTTDGASWTDMTLANTPADTPAIPAMNNNVYLGDYDYLTAVGKDFYGIFAAANMPVMANFPSGVTFQRNVDMGTGMLRDVTNTMNVNPSIDPFFFQVTDTTPDQDYYVRDWTLSPTSADSGQEPSTYPYFYLFSDVWNQRTMTANPFNASDQPVNEDARNGAAALGDNFMFARVHRNTTGSSGTVNLHFLYANFGAGLNYQDANPGVTDPTLVFTAASAAESMTTGFPWHLDATSSDHLCLGVEITGPMDAFVPPSLAGSSPGWPLTDLRIINDNNKAQRNIQILPTGTGAATGSVSGWAIAHNAATFPRTMVLRYEVPPEVIRKFGRARIEVAGREQVTVERQGRIELADMQPGENRWIRVTFDGSHGEVGEALPLTFFEMAGNVAVNGFAIAPQTMPLRDVIRYDLEHHRSVFARMAALLGSDAAANESRAAAKLLRTNKRVAEGDYVAFVKAHAKALQAAVAAASKRVGWQPPPAGELTSGGVPAIAATHLSALNDLDAVLTAVQLADGDPADILQNVRWQEALFRGVKGGGAVVAASREFIDGYTRRRLSNDDYPHFLKAQTDELRRAVAGKDLAGAIEEIERHLDSPRAAQKAHRAFLLALQSSGRE
jgi:hypothetical protein